MLRLNRIASIELAEFQQCSEDKYQKNKTMESQSVSSLAPFDALLQLTDELFACC